MIKTTTTQKTKYSNRPSPSLPAQDYKNQIQVGNDGKKYISLPDANTIYKWKLYDDYIDLTKFTNFNINVNNSILVTKNKFVCKMTENKINIFFDNEFIPEINGTEIKTSFNRLTKFYFNIDNIKYCILEFIYKGIYIQITFLLNKFDDKKYIERFKQISSDSSFFNIDTIPHNKIHHLGEMVLLNLKNIKNLKRNSKYIIIYGQTWSHDYDGVNSLAILYYNGYYFDSYQKKYIIDGIVYLIDKNKLIELNASEFMYASINCKDNDCNFGTGTGMDPVHLVIQLKKRIKLHELLTKI